MTGLAICTGVILIACSVLTYIYSGRVIRRNEPFWKVLVLYLLITILAAVATRYFQRAVHGAKAIIALLKFSASLPTVFFALKGHQLRPARFSRYILLAIGVGLIADIVININKAAGGALFLAGHLLYDVAFLSERKPSGRQLSLWLAMSALMIIPVYIFRAGIGSPFLCIGNWVYFSILISTVVFSWSLHKMVFAAALIFAFSDCFMIFNKISHGSMIMKVLALEVYYCSLLIYGAVLWKRNYHPAEMELIEAVSKTV